MSLFFELLWLDVIPAGTIIPPNALAPTLACLAALHLYGISSPAVAAVLIVACLPLGRLFSRLENYHRVFCNEGFNSFVLWVKNPGRPGGPAAMTRRSILVMFPINMAAFTLALAWLLALAHLGLPLLAPELSELKLTWPHLWAVGSIGAVLSLRHRPAYAVVLAGAFLAVFSRIIP
ncbi:hypothetical protein NNJEOMEG_03002 [Fundidesulfovibrio magnetotacticus]|uniref:Uncharacterized protein n=1 Tax=Fundidesulfovibrio magnetotacticus TaxID=2730080 RepID=A0A6V8LTU4_9BACT|nr:hypothetical protein NNJEOMEG_03002 [Fundidesulfovibrio magnetotacticus]